MVSLTLCSALLLTKAALCFEEVHLEVRPRVLSGGTSFPIFAILEVQSCIENECKSRVNKSTLHNLINSNCRFCVCPSSVFYAKLYGGPRATNPLFTMINASSGGGGTPPSPERDKVVEPTATEVDDSRFPGKIPTGSADLEKPGVTENKAASAGISENTFQGSKDPLSTVPEGTADGEIQDEEMSEPVEAETAGKQDNAGDDASLAAGHDTMTQLSLSQVDEEQRPPCHHRHSPTVTRSTDSDISSS